MAARTMVASLSQGAGSRHGAPLSRRPKPSQSGSFLVALTVNVAA